MKRVFSVLLLMVLLTACDKDSNRRNVNPFLPEYGFSVAINTNLAQYHGLTVPMNPVAVNIDGAGISGLIVMKISDTDYRAWEASCPNQYPQPCSKMTFEDGSLEAKCGCEGIKYNLITGLGGGAYTMKPYRYELSGENIRVYN